jgi:thiamine-phosphate pyrophosphorylase
MDDLYALCDVGVLERFGMSLEEFVAAAKLFGAAVVQYRHKDVESEERKEGFLRLRKLWDGPLVVNDDLELAPLCDGLHIGQEDLDAYTLRLGAKSRKEAIKRLRSLLGDRFLGLSTHDTHEIAEADGYDLDYIGLGAYRASSTKDVSVVLGAKLPRLAARSRHRVVAIGGIRLFEPIENVWLRAVGSDLCIKALTYA